MSKKSSTSKSTTKTTSTTTTTTTTDGNLKTNISKNQKILVVLVSNGVSDLQQASKQRTARNILAAKRVPYVEVDGMNPDHRESRNELFEISGTRGNYPQFFFVHSNGATSYIGDYDKIEQINETSDLPKEILEKHPEIQTWNEVFDGVVECFE